MILYNVHTCNVALALYTDTAAIEYKPIPNIVVAPVMRHLVSLVGMLVGKISKNGYGNEWRSQLTSSECGDGFV